MFSKFKEKDCQYVELKDIQDPNVLSQIIHYMYFNAVSLSPASVQDILSIANYLQIDSLTTACVQFIRERFAKAKLKFCAFVICENRYFIYQIRFCCWLCKACNILQPLMSFNFQD